MPSPNAGTNNTTEVALPRGPDEQPPKKGSSQKRNEIEVSSFPYTKQPCSSKSHTSKAFLHCSSCRIPSISTTPTSLKA